MLEGELLDCRIPLLSGLKNALTHLCVMNALLTHLSYEFEGRIQVV